MKTLIIILLNIFIILSCTKDIVCYICTTDITHTYIMSKPTPYILRTNTTSIIEEQCDVVDPISIINNRLRITEGPTTRIDSCIIITTNWTTNCVLK